jgi:hypothetical protein
MTQNKKYKSVEWTPTCKQLDAYYGIKIEKIKIKKKARKI